MDPVTVSINVDRPREEVFDYLADIANHSEFMDHLWSDWHLLRVDSYGKGAGASYRTNAKLDRFGWGSMTFIEVDPPRRIVGAGRGGKFNRLESYCEWTLEPISAGATRVTFMYETAPGLPTDKIMEAVSRRRRWYGRGARKAMRRLRTILEEDRDRGARTTVAGL